MELFIVRANANGCFAGVRINQPKICFAMKFFLQLLHRRGIAIRNGAIGSNKKQHDDPPLGRLEWINSFAIQILRPSLLPGLRSAKWHTKSNPQKCDANNFKQRYWRRVHGGWKSPPIFKQPQFYTVGLYS